MNKDKIANRMIEIENEAYLNYCENVEWHILKEGLDKETQKEYKKLWKQLNGIKLK